MVYLKDRGRSNNFLYHYKKSLYFTSSDDLRNFLKKACNLIVVGARNNKETILMNLCAEYEDSSQAANFCTIDDFFDYMTHIAIVLSNCFIEKKYDTVTAHRITGKVLERK